MCGDPADEAVPRPHEHGGTFGRGVVTATVPTGAVLPVTVELTANRGGYMEMRLCPVAGEAKKDRHCLPVCLVRLQ